MPARYRHCVPSSQNGMQTPDIASSWVNPPAGSFMFLISHSANCLSLIREKPVVAILSCSPSHTALLFFAPMWPCPSYTAFCWRTSHNLIFLSRDVVTSRAPFALQDKDCITSPSLRARLEEPVSASQILTVKSPEALARTFSAEGLKRTCPTFLMRH